LSIGRLPCGEQAYAIVSGHAHRRLEAPKRDFTRPSQTVMLKICGRLNTAQREACSARPASGAQLALILGAA